MVAVGHVASIGSVGTKLIKPDNILICARAQRWRIGVWLSSTAKRMGFDMPQNSKPHLGRQHKQCDRGHTAIAQGRWFAMLAVGTDSNEQHSLCSSLGDLRQHGVALAGRRPHKTWPLREVSWFEPNAGDQVDVTVVPLLVGYQNPALAVPSGTVYPKLSRVPSRLRIVTVPWHSVDHSKHGPVKINPGIGDLIIFWV